MSSLNSRVCNSTNTQAVDQSSFWDSGGIHWDAHRIGWVVAGAMAIGTVLIAAFNITMHCRRYSVPLQQRQIIRILLLPPVYAVISFFSYRYFRSYTYFALVESVWEALAIAAFLYLLVQYIGETPYDQRKILASSGKRKQPIPFCCWRYRRVMWSVLQYVFFRPVITIIGIICEATGTLCPDQLSVHFAQVYLDAFDFVVFSIALYGLIVFYAATRQQLQGRKPLSKFLTIKLLVFFTFYQGFVFSMLEQHNVIKGTEFWTATNVADGLQALCTTVEMVIFATVMIWSFPSKEYAGLPRQMGSTRAFLHSLNFSDFLLDLWYSTRFFFDYLRGKPGTSSKHRGGLDIDLAMADSEKKSITEPEMGYVPRSEPDSHPQGAFASEKAPPNSQGVSNGESAAQYANGDGAHPNGNGTHPQYA